ALTVVGGSLHSLGPGGLCSACLPCRLWRTVRDGRHGSVAWKKKISGLEKKTLELSQCCVAAASVAAVCL
ncbi:hypothetical protein QQF64_002818, partial [Cirrhinus molitorella]